MLYTLVLDESSTLTVPRDDQVTQQLVDPRGVYKHYDPYDLVSLAQQVIMKMSVVNCHYLSI